MLLSPRAFSALTRLEPMKPAAPVTTIYICGSVEKFFRVDYCGAEFANDNSGCLVGKRNGLGKTGAPRQHDTQNCNHRIPGTADIVHFPRNCGDMQALAFAVQSHAFLASRNQ